MKRFLWTGGIVASLMVGVVAPTPAAARGRLSWNGSVDDVTDVFVRQSRVREHSISGKTVDDVQYRFSRPLPLARVRVQLRGVSGRGRVIVFQQPNWRNDFTAGIRIRDPRPGRDRYHFDLVWGS